MNNKIEEYCGRVIIIQNEFKIKRLKNSFKCILFESALKVFMQPLKRFYVHNNTKNSRTLTLFILPSFRFCVSIHHLKFIKSLCTREQCIFYFNMSEMWLKRIYVFNNISKLISRKTYTSVFHPINTFSYRTTFSIMEGFFEFLFFQNTCYLHWHKKRESLC